MPQMMPSNRFKSSILTSKGADIDPWSTYKIHRLHKTPSKSHWFLHHRKWKWSKKYSNCIWSNLSTFRSLNFKTPGGYENLHWRKPLRVDVNSPVWNRLPEAMVEHHDCFRYPTGPVGTNDHLMKVLVHCNNFFIFIFCILKNKRKRKRKRKIIIRTSLVRFKNTILNRKCNHLDNFENHLIADICTNYAQLCRQNSLVQILHVFHIFDYNHFVLANCL